MFWQIVSAIAVIVGIIIILFGLYMFYEGDKSGGLEGVWFPLIGSIVALVGLAVTIAGLDGLGII